jgi:Putative MetA-pathway of phenol degradation
MARTHEKVRFLPKGKQTHTAASAAKGVEDVLRILEGRWKLVILFHLFGLRIEKIVTVARFLRAAAALALLLTPVSASAQELEPGAYWPIPKGLNIITVINNFNWGDVAFDPSAPIDEASARIDTTALAFTRAFSVGGRSANAGLVVPVIGGHVEGLYLGEPAEVGRFGQGDPRLRLAMNLYGAPSMTPQAFASYRLRTIVGVSVTVAPPLGQYDSAKLINLGTNRWSFKPEVGLSRAFGKWVLELMTGGWFFTDNTDFVGGRTRTQDPIAALQVHVTYRFKRTIWLAGDANYFTGGQTTIGGKQNLDLQRNSRIGATFSAALDRHQAIRMSVSRGAYTTIGADFTSVAVGYNYAWAR